MSTFSLFYTLDFVSTFYTCTINSLLYTLGNRDLSWGRELPKDMGQLVVQMTLVSQIMT